MSLNIYTKPGTPVRFSFPANGYKEDQQQANKWLKEGHTYHVQSIHQDGYKHLLVLKEIAFETFNSFMFEEIKDVEKKRLLDERNVFIQDLKDLNYALYASVDAKNAVDQAKVKVQNMIEKYWASE